MGATELVRVHAKSKKTLKEVGVAEAVRWDGHGLYPRNGQFYPRTRLQGAFHLVKERESICHRCDLSRVVQLVLLCRSSNRELFHHLA